MMVRPEQNRLPDVELDDERASEMSGTARWKVDRHIPVATILSLGLFVLVQTAALSYGWATMSGRIDTLEKASSPIATQGERLIRLETKFDAVNEALQEIKALLRQVPTRAAP